MSKIIVFAIVFGTTLFFWIAGGRIAWKAIVTGRLLARGVVYDRETNPGMYYGGLAFWISSIGLLTFASVIVANLKNIF